MKFQWTNCGTTYTGELLGFVCAAGTVQGIMLPADGFLHVVATDMLQQCKDASPSQTKQADTILIEGMEFDKKSLERVIRDLRALALDHGWDETWPAVSYLRELLGKLKSVQQAPIRQLSPDEERIHSFLDDRELAASLLRAYTGYVGTTMEVCREAGCWEGVARAARAHIAPESRNPATTLRLTLTPPQGASAGKFFQSKIALEAAERVLQSIYRLALEYGWKMDQPADVFLGDLLRRYVK